MLRVQRFVMFQVIAFFVIAVLGILYTGAHFVGISFAQHTYSVDVQLPNSGGIFTNAEVDYQGYPVGRVGALSLKAPRGCTSGCTGPYVYVQLHIDSTDRIPSTNTKAVVADLSAVGEQYVDLEPVTATGPALHSGSFIPARNTTIPVSDEVVLVNLNNFVKSVPLPQLETTVAELGKAFTATGPVLHQLVAAGDNLTQAASQDLPNNVTLINDGQQVLATQEAVSGDLQTFAANLAQFSGQLVASDPDYSALLPNGESAATQLQDLLAANESDLPVLLANLITVNQITDVRLQNIREIFVLYPGVVNDGFLVTPGDGTAHFGLNSDQGSPVCSPGYLPQSAERPGNGANPTQDYGGPANLNVDCNAPPTIDPRGARLAPRPAGDTTGNPAGHHYAPLTTAEAPYGPPPSSEVPNSQNGLSSPGAQGAATSQVVPYDPTSGAFAVPGGGSGVLGSQGGEASVLGPQSWEYLLLGPLQP